MSLEWLDFNDDVEWSLYGVTMSSLITGEQLSPVWPVYATSYEDAITTYQVLLYLSEGML